jgi:hypothetical protein
MLDLRLSTDSRLQKYGLRTKVWPFGLYDARIEIACSGGRDAAAAAARSLQSTESYLPTLEAVEIIRAVQLNGCNLQGSEIERVLLDQATKPHLPATKVAIAWALEDIRNGRTLLPAIRPRACQHLCTD